MPRAKAHILSLLERTGDLRRNIDENQRAVEQVRQTLVLELILLLTIPPQLQAAAGPEAEAQKPNLEEEEKNVRDLKARVAEARKKVGRLEIFDERKY